MAQTKVQLLQPDLGDVIDFDSSTLFMDGADNRVGIRNTNPQYELDVTGTVNATNFRGNIQVGTIDDWITHTGDTDTKIGFSAADTFQIHTAGSPRFTVNSGGHIVTQDLSGHTFNNDSSNAKILEVTGDGTVGEYGVINISGNQDANNTAIGNLRFINRQNSHSSTTNNAGSKMIAAIQAFVKTSDTNAGDDSGGCLAFYTKNEAAVSVESLRITEAGTVNIGGNLTQTTYKASITTGAVNKKISFGAASHNDLSNEGSGIFFSRQSDGSAELSGLFAHSNGGFGISTREYLTLHTGGGSTYGAAPERLRIHADGEVEIKPSVAGQTTLSVQALWASGQRVHIATFGRNGNDVKSAITYNHGTNIIEFGTTTNHGTSLVTNNTERIRILNTGLIAIGDGGSNLSNLDSQLTVTQTQGDCIRLRSVTGNNAFKYGIIKQEPYNNNAVGLHIIAAKSDSSYSEVAIGGGVDSGYAATQIDFYTGATTTTATGTKRARINLTGQLLLGPGSLATTKATLAGSLDLSSGGISLCIGGDENNTGRTNSTNKLNRVASPHYTNAEEPVAMVSSYNVSNQSIISYGGGSGLTNAVTSHVFYTAANTTTTSGTERLKINSTGHISIGEANFTPSNDVHIKRANGGGDVALRITNNSSTDSGTTASLYFTTSPTQDFNTAYIQALRDGGKLNFGYATNAPTLTMKVSTAQVGIGVTDPTAMLDINGAYNKHGLRVTSGASGYQDPLIVRRSTGGDTFRVSGNGSVVTESSTFDHYHHIVVEGGAGGSSTVNYLLIAKIGSTDDDDIRLDGEFTFTRATGTSGIGITRLRALLIANNQGGDVAYVTHSWYTRGSSGYCGIKGTWVTLSHSSSTYYAIRLDPAEGSNYWGTYPQHGSFSGVQNKCIGNGFGTIVTSGVTGVTELNDRLGGQVIRNSNIAVENGYVTADNLAYAYHGNCSCNGQAWVKCATVTGNQLSSEIELTAHDTLNSVVITATFYIKVAHYQDIWIESRSMAYSELKIKIVSNDNQNFDIYFQRTSGTTMSNIEFSIFPKNQEEVTLNSTVNYSGQSLEHTTSAGCLKITGAGGVGANLNIAGNLTKGSGSFSIPHPLTSKKDTHNLVHSFIEGPQCDLIYRGKVDLVGGSATVNIDTAAGMSNGTFVKLNRDVQCFTTNETGWSAIKGSVSGNVLTITAQDNSSTDTISWMVVGERQDDVIKKSVITDDDGNLLVEPLIFEEPDNSAKAQYYPS